MIELACIGQGAYLRHTAAMLHSVLTHATLPVRVHLLQEGPISSADRQRLEAILQPKGAQLMAHVIAARDLEGFSSGRFARAIWLRALLPQLLPACDKLLYLDSDIIVVSDIAPLWAEPLGTDLLAAVTNPLYPFMPPYPRQRLGIQDPALYFNSGVLLMNLAAMRAEKTLDKLRDFARNNPDCLYPDQDAYNIVCKGRWRMLRPRWNAQSTFFELKPEQLPGSREWAIQARNEPAIIHFIGPFKPWHYLCRHPLQHMYAAHARQTPWGFAALEGKSLENKILKYLPMRWIDRYRRLRRRLSRLSA